MSASLTEQGKLLFLVFMAYIYQYHFTMVAGHAITGV